MSQKWNRHRKQLGKKTARQLPLDTWRVETTGTAQFEVAPAGDGDDYLCMLCGEIGCDLLLSMSNARLNLRKLMGLHAECCEPWGVELRNGNAGNRDLGDTGRGPGAG